jgi:dTDP-4-amino-4,6-dideoxygalactose transaminase
MKIVDMIVKELMENNIEVRPLIAGNMASKPMWKKRYNTPILPNAELLESQGFYVPNHQDLTIVNIEKIVEIINKYE